MAASGTWRLTGTPAGPWNDPRAFFCACEENLRDHEGRDLDSGERLRGDMRGYTGRGSKSQIRAGCGCLDLVRKKVWKKFQKVLDRIHYLVYYLIVG